jgi:hypothetical protein
MDGTQIALSGTQTFDQVCIVNGATGYYLPSHICASIASRRLLVASEQVPATTQAARCQASATYE